jgi:8-oxo-dGTP pyrophosphatase MutT (NUDIX family)
MLSRRAARLLVLDDLGRVLLFQYADARGCWWATPGGGLEVDETFEQAAAREAREELGLNAVTLRATWDRVSEFDFRGTPVRQTERYFVVGRERGALALADSVREAHAAEGILAARWWSPAEIAAATEPIYPEDLLARLAEGHYA